METNQNAKKLYIYLQDNELELNDLPTFREYVLE
jgi:hypothetical protein